jgi:hypothetical protein
MPFELFQENNEVKIRQYVDIPSIVEVLDDESSVVLSCHIDRWYEHDQSSSILFANYVVFSSVTHDRKLTTIRIRHRKTNRILSEQAIMSIMPNGGNIYLYPTHFLTEKLPEVEVRFLDNEDNLNIYF